LILKRKKNGVASAPDSQRFFPPLQLIINSNFSYVPDYKDPSFLHQKYVVERLSIKEIAAQIFSSTSTVAKYLRLADIEVRPADAKNRNRLAYGEAWRRRSTEQHKRELEGIKKMQALRERGFSYWKIADVLNSLKVPTKTRRGKWHARSVKTILDRDDQIQNLNDNSQRRLQ
jgi:hypothetical protein